MERTDTGLQVAAPPQPRWAKIIDHTRCIGCHACTTACKSENQVPLSVTRTYVKYVDVGFYPEVRRAFQVTRCNQCEDAPCVAACPTGAMFRRPDGIVDFDKSICIGCKACIAACPYDAIFINPEDGSAEKCNFCAHRLDMGLEPACVVVCPTQAILIGDLDDPESHVAHIVNRETVAVRRPEKGTRPKLFYKGAHQATLDPLAARRPEGNLFLWSEQAPSGSKGRGTVTSGHPYARNNSAAAVLSYDVPHRVPWDWRVSLYTWTKGIAAGAYLVPLILLGTGMISGTSALWQWAAPIVAGIFLALTGGLLIWDLEHPARFTLIFTRRRWQSWLVRGAFILAGYAAILVAHFAASLTGARDAHGWLALAGVPLAVLTAAYTAYLFAEARGRDLWQNPLAPAHLVVQAVLAGGAALAGVALYLEPVAVPALLWTVSAACALHLLLVLAEATVTHTTAHAKLAVHEMIRGRYGLFFWAGAILVSVGMSAPVAGAWAVFAGLAGLLAYEHAYVQAGQAVPLA